MSATTRPVLSRLIRQIGGGLRSDRARDADLLAAFVADQDGDAFASLVARHGPLVWGVCRRGLSDPNDAEDAFQATFIALAHQAQQLTSQVVEHQSLAGWLYVTAQQIAHNERRSRMRRCEHERRAAAGRTSQADRPVEPVADLGAVLDEELGRLPARFRDLLVLCYLQGKTHAEAARQLGCPVGSVSGRLARGCEFLRDRLARRGVVLSAGQVTMAIAIGGTAGRASAAVPVGLAQAVVAAVRSMAMGGRAVAQSGRLAVSVLRAAGDSTVRTFGLLLVAALGTVVAVTGLVTLEPVHAERPPVDRTAKDPEAVERTDRFGDPLPEGAVARMGTLRFRTGQMGRASSVAFGPGGEQLLSAHGTDAVYVWDLATGRELRRLDAPRGCTGLAATSDGRRLVACGTSEVWAWDLTASPPLVLWKVKTPRNAPGNVELSPDGRLIACGNDAQGTVALYDAATGDEVRTLPVSGSGFAFSADSKQLAVWLRSPGLNPKAGTEVSVWNAATGARRYHLTAAKNREPVVTAAFSPDGKVLATAGKDRRLRLWNANDGKEQSQLANDAAANAFVGFLQDGNLVEAGGGRIRCWNAATGRPTRPAIKTEDTAEVYRLSADGARLAGAGMFGVGLREVATGRTLGPTAGMPDGLVHPVAFTPDSRGLVMGVYSETAGAGLYLWDAGDGRLRRRVEIGPRQLVWGLDVAADGAVSAACVPLYQVPSPPTRVVTWDADLGRTRSSLPLPSGTRCGVPSPDKRLVALAVQDRVALFDRASGKEVRALPGKCEAMSLAFSADGSWLGALDMTANRVSVWSLANGTTTTWAPAPPAAGKRVDLGPTLAMSPDGRLFAANVDRKVQVVETATGTELWRLDGHLSGLPVAEFAFSPDGRTLAAAGTDGAVRVWEVASGELRHRFAGHRSEVFSIAYSPNGRRLASASYDSTALVWDVFNPPHAAQARQAKPDDPLAAVAGRDAGAAYRAIAALAETPATTVPLLQARLRPPAASPDEVRRWLTELGAEQFAVREAATRELARRGDLVLPDLQRALSGTASSEARARLVRLINRLGVQSEEHRVAVRGIEILERMGANPSARQLLRELAEAPAESVLGREARAACRRLNPNQQR